MKKFIFLIAVLAFGMMATAQTTTYTLTTLDDVSGSFWSTADTIVTSGKRVAEVIRVRSAGAMDLQFQCNITKVSGTVTGTKIVFLYSNDNSTWVRADSVLLAGDASAVHFKNIDDFNYSYIKLWAIGVGSSAKTTMKVYYSFRKE